jgi:hypothetical protein
MMAMITNTFTQRGVLGGDPRSGPTPVSPWESGEEGELVMCMSSVFSSTGFLPADESQE